MYRLMRVLVCALCMIATPARAGEGPSFDCGKAQGAAEQEVCKDAGLARLDRVVAARYAAALEVAGKLDAGARQARDTLRAMQRGWIKGRNECWKAADLRDCIESEYLRREGQLVAQWLLDEPSSKVTWICDGNPSNELATWFFETELPSVRFEHGDTVDTGSLVRTASGSRYDGSFGRYIWIKGNEATYRQADPAGAQYQCVVSHTP